MIYIYCWKDQKPLRPPSKGPSKPMNRTNLSRGSLNLRQCVRAPHTCAHPCAHACADACLLQNRNEKPVPVRSVASKAKYEKAKYHVTNKQAVNSTSQEPCSCNMQGGPSILRGSKLFWKLATQTSSRYPVTFEFGWADAIQVNGTSLKRWMMGHTYALCVTY